MNIFGIDYGSKMAGTTVLAGLEGSDIFLRSSAKKQDADAFLMKELENRPPGTIYLDAPTSLPGKYRQLAGYEDYFYRKCDKAVRAMSPMFLGGLTARAMKLSEQLQTLGFKVIETYPAWQAQRLELKALGYKGKIAQLPEMLESLSQAMPFALPSPITTWHQVDALLALLGGIRHQQGTAETFGVAEEGWIVV